MKERPILFSGPMVRAILDGKKTQTRRVVKLWANATPGCGSRKTNLYDLDRATPDQGLGGGGYLKAPYCHKDDGWQVDPEDDTRTRVYPPWQVGDRLWVRETWLEDRIPGLSPETHGHIHYRATGNRIVNESWEGHWRPSIFMPRWASRITLEICDVRVERLQDISAEDARDEGVNRHSPTVRQMWLYGATEEERADIYLQACRTEFQQLWDSINAKRGYSWESNPWVWVIGFRRVP